MKKLTIVLCALSLVVLLSMPVLAEVQNIKVSGDITMRGFFRDNYSTSGSGGNRTLTGFSNTDSRDWYNTIAKLGVDADLTDNVMASLLLANERDWGVATSSSNVQIYSAYVVMKEMLYSPLTIKAGRMPVVVADGLLVGDGVINETGVLGTDYSAQTQFDTIHGILDFDPLTIVAGVLKISDAPQTTSDDVDGYLLDVIYKFNALKATLDTYILNAHYNSPQTTTGVAAAASTRGLDVWSLATRLTMEPAAGLNLDLGLAYQFGDYQKTATTSRDLKAWASNLGFNYALNVAMNPKLGAKYVYRSGNNNTGANDDFKGWQASFTNQVNGVIYNPNTNISALDFNASIMPLDKLSLSADLWLYNLAKKQTAVAGSTSDKRAAGTELDLAAKYAYTEDVSLGLSLAYFFPGDYYVDGNDKTAKQAMLELGVKF